MAADDPTHDAAIQKIREVTKEWVATYRKGGNYQGQAIIRVCAVSLEERYTAADNAAEDSHLYVVIVVLYSAQSARLPAETEARAADCTHKLAAVLRCRPCTQEHLHCPECAGWSLQQLWPHRTGAQEALGPHQQGAVPAFLTLTM